MKAPLLACAITTVIATAALAASSSGSFSISGGGKTGWSLECTLTKADGSVSTAAIAANNGVVARIDRNDISSAACKAKAPAHGDVTFTLEKKAFNCPYPKDRRGVCSWRMENGQTGDFTTSVGEQRRQSWPILEEYAAPRGLLYGYSLFNDLPYGLEGYEMYYSV